MQVHSIRRCCASLGALLGLLSGLACARPETVLRERPAQRLELIQKMKGLTPEEERTLLSRVAAGLSLPSSSSEPAAGASTRVLQLTLTGGPNRAENWGLGKTCLASIGTGTLFGALLGSGLPFYVMPTSWKGPGIGAGVGFILGAVYGPMEYRKNQATKRDMGYLPWVINAEWSVLDRSPGSERVAARSRPVLLDLRPFLHPVSEGPGHGEAVRRANLEACARALTQRIQGGAPGPGTPGPP